MESIFPAGMLTLSPDLERINAPLGDERFFRLHRAFFDTPLGRPSIPTETHVRLMLDQGHRSPYQAGPTSLGARLRHPDLADRPRPKGVIDWPARTVVNTLRRQASWSKASFVASTSSRQAWPARRSARPGQGRPCPA